MANAILLKPLPATALTTSTAAGYDPSYAFNDYMGVVWKSTAHTLVSFYLDLGADVPLNTIILLGCDGATSSWSLAVSANTAAQGSDMTTPGYTAPSISFLAGANLPTSGRGISYWEAPANFPAAVRYLQLKITGMSNASAVIARIVIGTRIQLARNFSNGIQLGVKELGGVDFSRYGGFLRSRGAKLRTLGLTFSSIYKDEVEAAVQPLLEQIGGTEPIAIVTDPAADPMRQRRIFYGPLTPDNLGTAQRKAKFWQAQLSMVSLV